MVTILLTLCRVLLTLLRIAHEAPSKARLREFSAERSKSTPNLTRSQLYLHLRLQLPSLGYVFLREDMRRTAIQQPRRELTLNPKP